jgi:5-methylcytosine-specific restriction endonuclease McrA
MAAINKLQAIFSKTSGHCHFCGDPLVFERRGMKSGTALPGAWEVDHVIQKAKGGRKETDNCLPACVQCNRLRWHRKGKAIRELLLLGLVAKKEIKKASETGKALSLLRKKHEASNVKRRKR